MGDLQSHGEFCDFQTNRWNCLVNVIWFYKNVCFGSVFFKQRSSEAVRSYSDLTVPGRICKDSTAQRGEKKYVIMWIKNPASTLKLRKSQYFKKQTQLLRSLQSQRIASVTALPGCTGKTRSTQGLSTMPPSWLEATSSLLCPRQWK